jgi:hypothetical protein
VEKVGSYFVIPVKLVIDNRNNMLQKLYRSSIFMFSEKIGFLALYGKEYFPVSCLGLRKDNSITHIPNVVKILMDKNYYEDGRNNKAA